jgi:uncharacterized Zn finger protein (UPF0148 family)
MYGCVRYPDCDFAVNHPPIADTPCPRCGSLLVNRPKSIRCWGCGAELDHDLNVTKDGDPEAEAAARAARSAARAARAAKKAGNARSPAKRKTAAKKKASARAAPAAEAQDTAAEG